MSDISTGISVVSPVYCSSSTLPDLVKRIVETLENIGEPFEVILADDHSPDNSWEVINMLSAAYPGVQGLRLQRNCGQMSATLAGMSRAKGKYIVTIDDDLEYAPEDIAILFRTIRETGSDVVFGLSEEKYEKQGRHPGLAGWRNNLLNRFWRKPVTDSFKILARSVVFSAGKFLPEIHFEAFISKARHPVSISYCNVSYHQRAFGNSNQGFLKKAGLFFRLTFDYYRLKASQLYVIFILAAFFAYPALSNPARLSSIVLLSILSLLALGAVAYFIAQSRWRAIPPASFEGLITTQLN